MPRNFVARFHRWLHDKPSPKFYIAIRRTHCHHEPTKHITGFAAPPLEPCRGFRRDLIWIDAVFVFAPPPSLYPYHHPTSAHMRHRLIRANVWSIISIRSLFITTLPTQTNITLTSKEEKNRITRRTREEEEEEVFFCSFFFSLVFLLT